MPFQTAVLASGNKGKLNEFKLLLAPIEFELRPQSHYKIDAIPETGASFLENALLKARHASRLTSLPALADDSGLVVPSLNGAPGIYSARYAGTSATAATVFQELRGWDHQHGKPSLGSNWTSKWISDSLLGTSCKSSTTK